MKVLDQTIKRAMDQGLAIQVIVTDRDGLVIEQAGDRFRMEQLVSSVLEIWKSLESLEVNLGISPVSEVTFKPSAENFTVAAIFFHVQEEPFVLIVVTPSGHSYRVLTADIIRRFTKHWAPS
jgi:hypothetical protein